jgi:hypothetical protein
MKPTLALLSGSDILQDILTSTELPVVIVIEGPTVAKFIYKGPVGPNGGVCSDVDTVAPFAPAIPCGPVAPVAPVAP